MRETARKIRLKLPLIIGGASTIIASSAMAQGEGPDLWASATTAANDAAGNVSTFLLAVFAIPLAFFAYRLIRGALSRGA